jgi:hypothetical protein
MVSTQQTVEPIGRPRDLALGLFSHSGLVVCLIFLASAGVGYLLDVYVPWGIHNLLQILAYELAALSCLGFVALSSRVQAINSYNLFASDSSRRDYENCFAANVERSLLLGGVLAAIAITVIAFAAQFWPMPSHYGTAIVAALYMYFAAIVPVDCGAMLRNRKQAIMFALIVPWAFVIAFPCYIRERAPRLKRATLIASMSMIVLVISYSMFMLAAR